MSVVTIQEMGKTSKGNPKAKINGEWYFLSAEIGTQLPPINTKLEVKTGEFTFSDGKPGKTLEAWRYPPGNGQAPSQQNAPAPAAPPAYLEEASLRYISNCIGSAIAAKTITAPGQIDAWFKAAKASLEVKPAPAPYNDEMPEDRWGDPQ